MSSNAPKTPRTPKTPKNLDAEAAQHIVILCHLMMCSDNFEASSTKLAPILGISHAKNVQVSHRVIPRKINSIIGPHGFEFKGNKIVKKDDAEVPATPSGSGDDVADTPAKKDGAKAAKKSPTKKRKIEKVIKDEDEQMTSADGEVKTEPKEAEKDAVKDEENDEEKMPSEFYAPSV